MRRTRWSSCCCLSDGDGGYDCDVVGDGVGGDGVVVVGVEMQLLRVLDYSRERIGCSC